ncbi:SGNH/GDSL hydrolase family protein [uncultured Sphingomonas sp.]|uniref:SGNH/GDSL hydrolase family protein n=1 Tax=uncultured Sphingomonas sp. TaxID=158754 RepID=UPI002632E53D|nr:SGNH/GDSL hydrolase family protein [uncultured Sphingomonas sp.]
MALDIEAQGLALGARALAEARHEGYFPVACRTGAAFGRAVAANNPGVARTRHVLPYGAIDLMPVYAGWTLQPGEVSTAALSGIHLGIEPTWGAQSMWGATGNGAAVVRRVSANGNLSPSVPADHLLLPEPVAVNRRAGEAIGTRIWVPSGSGYAASRSVLAGQDYCYIGANATDWAWGGTITGASPLASTIQPIAILGRTPDRRRHPAVAIVGDSIGYGNVSMSDGALGWDNDADGNSGWIERALANRVAWSNLSAPGDRLDYLTNVNGGAGGRRVGRSNALRRLGYTHVIHALSGTNDAFAGLTLAQIQDRWLNWTDELVGMGHRVWAVTPLPHTASSDSWATLANQSVTPPGAVLVQMADWIRANARAYGCERVIDLAALVDNGSGRWRVDLAAQLGAPPTYDGVHPASLMTQWIAAQGLIGAGLN